MSSLTKTLQPLLNKKVSFTRLLKKRGIWDRINAENVMVVAIKNLKKKKDINSQQVEDLEKDWQNFLNSTEANMFFETHKNKPV
ncbi:hypothetical protein RO3G_05315 [Rhizopus delemar RA 99-880]|uniref:Uncharacterized protein n=1 Tax=Rhizopus delemar (strain RA 99-880 / ATCC MYA-4621 / FGSC 9543 / NRRL 43880) TaxID=246409 RepID=I1BWN0_RHIO9|nr:hypothetical protein RO3G_05315 [Rhizopus delemar RA 99-880]|eukprot:EIE80610.1 hypothetical protein RO3G_05315 [Rhizopus delemar RA 99-880]